MRQSYADASVAGDVFSVKACTDVASHSHELLAEHKERGT